MAENTPMRIHIGHHFFGAGNIGDDLTLAGFARALAPFRDRFRFTCCVPRDPASQMRRFPFIQWCSYDLSERQSRVSACDAWLGVGDSPFQSDSGSWFSEHLREEAELCSRFGKPMYFLGVGVNDREAMKNPVVLDLLSRARRIWTRDQHSLTLIRSACPQSRVAAGSDLANLELAARQRLPLAADQIGFVLNFEAVPGEFLSQFPSIATQTREQTLVWMRQEVRRFPGSESTLIDLLPTAVQDSFVQREVNYETATLDDLLHTLSGAAAMVTSRYHAALIGAWQGSRVTVYCRNEKLQGIASQLGLSTFDEFNVQAIEEALERSRRIDDDVLVQLEASAIAAAAECFMMLLGLKGDFVEVGNVTDSAERPSVRPLAQVLAQFPSERDIVFISEQRSFQHPEDAYDQQYGIDKLNLEFHAQEGSGLVELCQDFGCDLTGPILEIGCGTGRLSLSLVMAANSREVLLTDPSQAFCEITLRKLSMLSRDFSHVKVAVLRAEDVSKLPRNSFSLIVLRSVLHHVLDVARFLEECSDILTPGGALLFEEPCAEGYILMGAMTQFMPALFKSEGIALSAKHKRDIQIFANAMIYYARRDLDKSTAEDKHLFRPEELRRMCEACGMRLEFFPNRVFANIRARNQALPDNYFEQFYMRYAEYALSWDAELLSLFDRHVREYLQYFAPLATDGALPITYGSFLCKKLEKA